MTTTNRLCYTVSKRYIQAGTTFEMMALYRKVYTNVQHFINNKLCFV